MGETQIHVQLHQQRDYQFEIRFGSGIPDILGDEPAPLGSGLGQFESTCTVTQRVSQGIAVRTEVVDALGIRLK